MKVIVVSGCRAMDSGQQTKEDQEEIFWGIKWGAQMF